MPIAHLLKWEESEASWGCRPDGVSLHLSLAHAKAYLQSFYAQRKGSPTPSCYHQPECAQPQAVEVDQSLYDEVVAAGGNLRAYDVRVHVSATGTRRAIRKGRFEGETFMALVAQKKAHLSEVDAYVERWHNHEVGQGTELHEVLGLTPSQYAEFVRNPDVLAEIALAQALQTLPAQLTQHLKSQGDYLLLGEGKLESTLQPVCVYLGVDGQLWVRDAAEFRDGRFAVKEATPTLSVDFRRKA